MKIVYVSCLAAFMFGAQADHDAAKLLQDEQSLASPLELQLATSSTSTVYRAEAGKWQFNLHSYIAWYKGKYWAIWSAGKVDEDSGQQRIHYATSTDGHHWSAAGML